MKQLLILIFSLFLFTACSPQKKLNRLVKKYPELLIKDTLLIRDTLILKEKIEEFKLSIKKDTLITKDKLSVDYKLADKDSATIKVFIKKDTFYLEKEVVVDKVEQIIKEKKDYRNSFFWDKIIFYLILIFAILFSMFLLKLFN